MKARPFWPSALALALAPIGVASADDSFPPSWRGNPNSITAAWDFWGAPGPGPGIVTPGFYQANPDILPDLKAWAQWDSQTLVQNSLFGRTSVLEVGFTSVPSDVGFAVRNYSGFDQTYVRIQVTYWPDGGAPLSFGSGDVPGDPPWQFPDTFPAIASNTTVHPDGWVTSSYDWLLDPSPAIAGVGVLFINYPAYIDQVVIDTWAVPAPGSVTLVAFGGALLARRRRR